MAYEEDEESVGWDEITEPLLKEVVVGQYDTDEEECDYDEGRPKGWS